jgi:hypothetical protein
MKNQQGFSAVEALLILIIAGLVGFTGWFVLSAKSTASKSLATSANVSDQQVAKSDTVNDFYSCWRVVGSVSQSVPSICIYSGKSYQSPAKFDRNQILSISKVPAAIQGPVVTAAQAEFEKCTGSGLPARQAEVMLAQTNFVDISLGCGSVYHQYFGAEHNIWTDLGTSQTGLSCENVDKYQIGLSSVVNPDHKSAYQTCSYQSGKTEQLPV